MNDCEGCDWATSIDDGTINRSIDGGGIENVFMCNCYPHWSYFHSFPLTHDDVYLRERCLKFDNDLSCCHQKFIYHLIPLKTKSLNSLSLSDPGHGIRTTHTPINILKGRKREKINFSIDYWWSWVSKEFVKHRQRWQQSSEFESVLIRYFISKVQEWERVRRLAMMKLLCR